MSSERIVSGSKFLAGIRAGMTVRELMEEHNLSLGELSTIFVQLETAGVNVLRLYGRTRSGPEEQDKRRIRFLPRRKVMARVPVIDTKEPANIGLLIDVTERGLCVTGFRVQDRELKNLEIAADHVFRVGSFQLQAECRWTATAGFDQESISGFKIARISESDLRELRRFVGMLAETNPEPDASHRPGFFAAAVDLTGEMGDGWTCPSCEAWYESEQDECPQCGIIASKYMHLLERTKTQVLDPPGEPPEVRVETTTLAAAQSLRTTITASEKLVQELKALGGDLNDHVNKALEEYLDRNRTRKE
jgi:hypothetical protein